jgi:hypothetical protein
MRQILIKIQGQFEIFRKKSTITFCSQLCFVRVKAFLVAYDFEELYRRLELQVIKIKYVKGCPKWQPTQIWLLKILEINLEFLGLVQKNS